MDTVLRTTAGPLRGVVVDGVRAFLGVPYGASTAGAGRFMAPRPVEPWNGVRDALDHGPSAWQPPPLGGEAVLSMWGGRPEASMSEDCLVCNVWAPLEVKEPVPVVVFLHGGGYGLGSGSWAAYDGSRMARRGDVVVVTVNHRLGILGFLHLADLAGPRFATSGINGILDVVEALRWIRANIAEVGGDPGRVLVYGQSGGGAKTAALLAVPSAWGLFHAAGIMSCPDFTLRSPADATAMTERVLAHLGIAPADADALCALPAERLVEANLAVGDALSSFQPVLDGTWAVAQPIEVVADGRAPDVPLLVGTTRDEFATFFPDVFLPPEQDDAWVADAVRSLVGDRTESVVAAYRASRPEASPRALQLAISSDAMFRIGSIRFAEARAAAGGAPVWMYRFDWETPAEGMAGTAPHGIDTTFFADNVGRAPVSARGPGRERLAAAASSSLVALAARGSPEHPGLPAWPPYDGVRRATMLLDAESHVVDDPAADARRIWATIPPGP